MEWLDPKTRKIVEVKEYTYTQLNEYKPPLFYSLFIMPFCFYAVCQFT